MILYLLIASKLIDFVKRCVKRSGIEPKTGLENSGKFFSHIAGHPDFIPVDCSCFHAYDMQFVSMMCLHFGVVVMQSELQVVITPKFMRPSVASSRFVGTTATELQLKPVLCCTGEMLVYMSFGIYSSFIH